MIKSETYDVIVVGSGPGGATVAKELSERGKRVLILEWGEHDPIKGTILQASRSVFVPGKGLLFTPDLASVFRGIVSGGSTIFYYGTAFDPPVELFKKYGIDLSAEVDEIRHELPTDPLDDSLIGPMAKRIMDSARELGYDWRKLPKFIFQDRCEAGCWRCGYGCPRDAKWSGRMFVNRSLEKGARLITGVKVSKVLIKNGKAIGVEGKKGVRTVQFMAPTIVVSAGGIGSPVILNSSGIREVGREFFFDPLIAVMGAVNNMDGGREIPMATGCHMDEEGYLMTDMTMPRALFGLFNLRVLKPRKLWLHSKTLTIMIKAKDSLGGRITNRGRVKKRVDPSDREKLALGFERAKKILRNAGAKEVYRSGYLAAHPGGTAKIGEIVDADLQTTIPNLYVCDCSVIPEAWGLPPTFSLIALGKRLAKRLAAT